MLKEDFSISLLPHGGREIRLENGDSFRNFLQMEPTMFDEL